MALLNSLKYRNFHIVMTMDHSRMASVYQRRSRWVAGNLAKSRCTAGKNSTSNFGSTQIGVR